MRTIKKIALAAVLSGVMILGTACGSESSTSVSSGETVSGEAENSESSSASDSNTVSDDGAGSEEETVSELGTISDDEPVDNALMGAEGPYQSEMNEYLEANTTESLLSSHEAVQFDAELFALDGSAYSSYSALLKKDLKYLSYSDGTEWLLRENQIDGYDSGVGAPFRAVFPDDGTMEVLEDEFSQLFYLYYGESVDEMKEDDDTVIFTSYLKDTDEIGYQVGDGAGTAAEGSQVKRVTTFNKTTKGLVSSVATYEVNGADPVTVENISLTTDVGDSSEVEDLTAKLDASDTHSIKIVIEPGTDNETTVTSSVGKGCFFNLMLGDYSFYTDEACTDAAPDDILYNTEKDISLYAKEDTADSFDEDSALTDIDGEEFEFDVSSVDVEPEG